MVTLEQSEQCVKHIRKRYKKVTHSRACKLIGCSRKRKYYKKKVLQKDKPIVKAIREVIGFSRKGRGKVIKLVQKKHPEMGASRIRRVYEKEGFSLSKKPSKRIKDNPKNPISVSFALNEEWAMDFMSDSLINGQRIRTLNIIDHYNRECKGIHIAKNCPARILIWYLEIIIEKYGAPKRIRTDNGPEFRSKQFQKWMDNKKILWNRIQKGHPEQNAIIERFNRTFREDVLDANVFYSVSEAQKITDSWLDDYNHVRPHQSLGYLAPSKFVA